MVVHLLFLILLFTLEFLIIKIIGMKKKKFCYEKKLLENVGKANCFATSLLQSMDRTKVKDASRITVRITTEYCSARMKQYIDCYPVLSVRVGRSVVVGICPSRPLKVVKRVVMSRNMLLAILLCLKFFKINLPARSVCQGDAQLSALSLILTRSCRKCTQEELLKKIIELINGMDPLSITMFLFPSLCYLDTSQSVKAMARCLVHRNYVYIRDLTFSAMTYQR